MKYIPDGGPGMAPPVNSSPKGTPSIMDPPKGDQTPSRLGPTPKGGPGGSNVPIRPVPGGRR